MKLKVLNSNSKGNCYILTSNDGSCLILECGVNFDLIKRSINFKISKVAGCLLTHSHLDHCKSARKVIKAGIMIYSSHGTLEEIGLLDHHRVKAVEHDKVYKIGEFLFKPFNVKHDTKEPFGYLINHPESGEILFLTDTFYCSYTFMNLSHVIIEANYCEQILQQRIESGANPKFIRDRVIQSHMSLQTCKKTLTTYNLSKVINIVLIHLSDGNSDAKRFKKEVEQITGKSVSIAAPEMEIDLNKEPF